MHKDELLELREQTAIIKDHSSICDHVDSSPFDPYNGLAIEPPRIHKSKSEHKHAVFVLGNILATAMSDDGFSNAGRIGKRMRELAGNAEGRI